MIPGGVSRVTARARGTPYGPGMANSQIVSDSITVDAPASTVFAILADPRQHARIDGGGSVQDLLSGPDRLSKGATFTVAMKLGVPYRIKNTVVEFEEDRRIAWRHFGGHRWRYELEPVGDGTTKVTESFDYSRYDGPRAFLVKALGFPERNRKGIAGTLRRLKDAAESDAAA